MKARILDGRETSKKIKEGLSARIREFEERGIKPALATIIAGGDPASHSYVKNQVKACRETGLEVYVYEFPEEVSERSLLETLEELNERKDIHGIMVQIPLPSHINEDRVSRSIKPEKDVDGLHPENSGRLLRGEKCLLPCTPKGVLRLLEEYGIAVAGKKAGVVGRSSIVGKPVSLLLLNRNATVVTCHSRTKNLGEELRTCDIVVSAVGRPGIIRADMLKQDAVVIDVGTTVVEGRLRGDVDFEGASEVASFITPVPGGAGAMTTAMLIENVLEAVEFYD